MNVYPNPTSGKLYFDLQNVESLSIEMFDLMGKKVFFISDYNIAGIPTSIDISNLPNGFYIMELKINNEVVSSQKVVKQ